MPPNIYLIPPSSSPISCPSSRQFRSTPNPPSKSSIFLTIPRTRSTRRRRTPSMAHQQLRPSPHSDRAPPCSPTQTDPEDASWLFYRHHHTSDDPATDQEAIDAQLIDCLYYYRRILQHHEQHPEEFRTIHEIFQVQHLSHLYMKIDQHTRHSQHPPVWTDDEKTELRTCLLFLDATPDSLALPHSAGPSRTSS
jgi:hypothetical protein